MNKGKQFEGLFKQQWMQCFPASFLLRLYDTTNGYTGITNPCDFIAFIKPNIYLLELKSHQGASFPLDNLTQFDKLYAASSVEGLRAGMILWLIDRDFVGYIPASTMKQLKDDGYKSFNPEKLKDKYFFITIPSVKKRVFMETDYKYLVEKLNEEGL